MQPISRIFAETHVKTTSHLSLFRVKCKQMWFSTENVVSEEGIDLKSVMYLINIFYAYAILRYCGHEKRALEKLTIFL